MSIHYNDGFLDASRRLGTHPPDTLEDKAEYMRGYSDGLRSVFAVMFNVDTGIKTDSIPCGQAPEDRLSLQEQQ